MDVKQAIPRILHLLAIIVVAGCRLGYAADQAQRSEMQVQDYPGQDYPGQQQPRPDDQMYQDYGQVVETVTRPPIQCYTCHFHIQKGHTQGMPNCDHKFMKEGIPIVPCKGPCAKVFQQLNEDEFILTRNCVPSCKDFSEENSYTECCSSDLCNAAPPRSASHVITLLSLTIFVAISALCGCFR